MNKPTYKGNAGHLMQHWTLCEMLRVAACKGVTGLNFIDAHAMAPLATKKVGKPGLGKDKLFKLAESRLPNIGDLAVAYGQAWHQLTSGLRPPKGYPNSAAFVEQVWKGKFAMLLCETEPKTRKKIELWRQHVDKLERCETAKLFCGDWRERFKKGLPSPAEVGLPDGSLTLVLFDPNMYYPRNVIKPGPEILYPEDLKMAARAMESLEGGILIQLSTYSAKDARQEVVIASVRHILESNSFTPLAKVRINGNMMSLVYARKVSWDTELTELPGRFDEWLRQLSRLDR